MRAVGLGLCHEVVEIDLVVGTTHGPSDLPCPREESDKVHNAHIPLFICDVEVRGTSIVGLIPNGNFPVLIQCFLKFRDMFTEESPLTLMFKVPAGPLVKDQLGLTGELLGLELQIPLKVDGGAGGHDAQLKGSVGVNLTAMLLEGGEDDVRGEWLTTVGQSLKVP